MEKVRLLVVDDDPPIADLVATVARYEGWDAVTANSGEEALRRAAEFHPDIVVLDLMLPGLDGFAVLDRLRQSGTMVPVVFLTARDGVADRVAGLTRGGDDYLVKPFAVEELMARLRTVLRRSAGPGFQRSVLRVADLTMDEDTREVRRADRRLTLTPTEYEVLRYLMRKSPTVLTKAQILDHVWEYGFGGRSNVVELVVSRLRRKLDDSGESDGGKSDSGNSDGAKSDGAKSDGAKSDGAKSDGGKSDSGESLIHTVRGVGYVLRQDAE